MNQTVTESEFPMRCVTSAAVLLVAIVATSAMSSPVLGQNIVDCRWNASVAPFFVRVSNLADGAVKLLCPAQFDRCSGDMSQPNHYNDCPTEIPRGMTDVLLNERGLHRRRTEGSYSTLIPPSKVDCSGRRS